MPAKIENKSVMFTVREISEILGSVQEGDSEFPLSPVTGIEIDSNRMGDDFLFVAVRGEHRDGHEFLEAAFSNGAVAAVVSRDVAKARGLRGPRYIVVKDTVFALGELARIYRKRFDIDIVAVTGSNGKTTVKNLIFEILSKTGKALKSEKNYNNFYGLPLSIFKLTKDHKSAVFELGMSAPGEIARLGEIASPDVGVITNVGPAHIEFFGSLEKIAETKLEIQGTIAGNGTLVINGDDKLLMKKVRRDGVNLVTFGLDGSNDFHPRNLEFDDNQNPNFIVDGSTIRSNLTGVHNVYNLLTAFAVSQILGIDPKSASAALETYRPSEMRSEVVKRGGISFIVDCYNANPVSMKYALDTISKMKCDGRRIAVLGDMLELGDNSRDYHGEIGKYAAQVNIDHIFCFGSLAREIVRSFGKNGRHFEDKDELSRELFAFLRKGDLVLLKASRGMAFEEIFNDLIGKP